MFAIELAYIKGWYNLWFVSDSQLVVAAFKKHCSLSFLIDRLTV